MNIAQVLIHMGYRVNEDFMVFDHGNGPELHWYHTDPKPSEAELAAAWPSARKQIEVGRKRARLDGRKNGRLLAAFVRALADKGLIAPPDLPSEVQDEYHELMAELHELEDVERQHPR